MDPRTQAEYDRIKAGPHNGEFSFVHHKGPVVEHSENIMGRVDFILSNKDPTEHYDRLRHIYRLPDEMAQCCKEAEVIYDKARMDARVIYDNACKEAWVIYDNACKEAGVLDLIPNCGWNGKTIFEVKKES